MKNNLAPQYEKNIHHSPLYALFLFLRTLSGASCNWATRDCGPKKGKTACPLQVCGRQRSSTGGRMIAAGDWEVSHQAGNRTVKTP